MPAATENIVIDFSTHDASFCLLHKEDWQCHTIYNPVCPSTVKLMKCCCIQWVQLDQCFCGICTSCKWIQQSGQGTCLLQTRHTKLHWCWGHCCESNGTALTGVLASVCCSETLASASHAFWGSSLAQEGPAMHSWAPRKVRGQKRCAVRHVIWETLTRPAASHS